MASQWCYVKRKLITLKSESLQLNLTYSNFYRNVNKLDCNLSKIIEKTCFSH